MLTEIILGLAFWAIGALYIVFAYREPPRAIEHFFRIPSLFIFFPEHNRVRLGRISLGPLLGLGGAVMIGKAIYRFLLALL